MEQPDLSVFAQQSQIQKDMAEHEHGYGEPQGSLFVFAQAAIFRAQPLLVDFTGAALLDTRLVFCLAPASARYRREEKVTGVELTLKTSGWTMTDLGRRFSAGKAFEKIYSSPFELLKASGQHTVGACADMFLRLLRAGLFPIDAALPGAAASKTHPGSLNALSFCCAHGRPDWTRLLLSLGADPNHQGAYGKSALHHCAGLAHMSSSTECARLLFGAGADPRALSDSGKTPAASLHIANKDTETGALLIGAARCALEAKRIAKAASSPTPKACGSDPENISGAAPRPKLSRL
jgi:hypothetical protein